MSPATETALPAKNELGFWLDSPARTDPEFFEAITRFYHRALVDVSSWTEDFQKRHELESTESSTTPLKDEDIERKFKALFEKAEELQFEDGIESEFSRGLVSLVRKYGRASKGVLARLIHGNVSSEVSSEALRWLGRMDDPATYSTRLWLLQRGLSCSSAKVRDGALLGLASLDDPRAIPYLQKALALEPCEELRKDMQLALTQLQDAC